MIGLDTNVIIRYLTQDDARQSHLANKVINEAIEKGNLLWISHLTLVETIWVLERAYKTSKIQMIEVIHILLQTEELILEKHDIVWRSLQDYKSCKSVGFADCLIGRSNVSNDCQYTYTFDKEVSKELGTFQLLKN